MVYIGWQGTYIQYVRVKKVKRVPVPNGKGIVKLLQYGTFAPLLWHFCITTAAFQPAEVQLYLSGSRAYDARAVFMRILEDCKYGVNMCARSHMYVYVIYA